jgi:hypothetical protein
MFEKIVDENRNITTITVKWGDDFRKAMSVLKTFFNDNNTEHLMLDLRESSIDTITYDDVSDLFQYATTRTNDNGENRLNGKTALVGSSDLQSEVEAIFKTCFETEDLPINVSVFGSEDKALNWLEED